MTEEVKTEQVQTEQTAPELSPIEQRAMEMGWRPKEEFQGEEDDFIDAKEFVRRKPLFDKIESQSKEIKNVRKAVEALKEHYSQREEAAVNAALAKLREARKEAIANSDGESFDALDTEIKRVEGQAKELKRLDQAKVEEVQELHPEFVAWTNRNKWYADVSYMRKWADDYGAELHKQGMTPPEVLRKVEEGVKREFPNKFKNPNKDLAPDVESSSRSGSKGSRETMELTEQERKVMNMLVSTQTMTKDEYLASLKATKENKSK